MWQGSLFYALSSCLVTNLLFNLIFGMRAYYLINESTGERILFSGIFTSSVICILFYLMNLESVDWPNCKVPGNLRLIWSTSCISKHDSLIFIFSPLLRASYCSILNYGICFFPVTGSGKGSRNWNRCSWALFTWKAGLFVCLLKSMKPVDRFFTTV